MLHALSLITFGAYLISFALFVYALMVRHKNAHGALIERAGGVLLRLGVLAHMGTLAYVSTTKNVALVSDAGDYYLWVSFGIALLFVLAPKRLVSGGALSACTSGLVLLTFVSSSLLLHLTAGAVPVSRTIILLHVIPALIAEVMLLSASALCVAFLVQGRRLKKKRGDLLGGPNLEQLDRLSLTLTKYGFLAMSIAVLSGVVWAVLSGERILHSDPTQYAALATWLVLAAILHARSTLSWSMRRTALWTIVVVGVFVLSMLGSLFSSGGSFHGLSLSASSAREV